jgi:hypothetical protein
LGVSGYWSLSGYAKRKVKTAVSFIFDFEESVAHCVKSRGVDGVICGHIHAAAIKELDGIRYLNCGDWVDSCTAIVEHLDGRMELIEWGIQHPQTHTPAKAGDACAELLLHSRHVPHPCRPGAIPRLAALVASPRALARALFRSAGTRAS